MSNTSEDTKRYELMAIIMPDIGEAAIKKRIEKIRSNITDMKGEIVFEEAWGLRDLAYPIRKQVQGFYTVLDFNLEPEHLQELDRILRLDTEVLRHILMVLPAYYQPLSYAKIEEGPEEMVEEKKVRAPGKKIEIPKEAEVKVEEKPVEPKEKEKEKEVKEEEVKAEPAPKAPRKKEEPKQQTLEDIDKKLDSILQNPDINF